MASTSSPIEKRIVGSVNVRWPFSAAESTVAACSRLSTTQGSDEAQVVACGEVGQVNGRPAASSRMMSLMNAEGWPVRAGGRASTPGSRSERPSTQPRRLKSATSVSPISEPRLLLQGAQDRIQDRRGGGSGSLDEHRHGNLLRAADQVPGW